MSNEITMRLNCDIEDICNLLENKKFQVTKRFILDDTYFIPTDLALKDMSYREILSKAILLRDITDLISETRTIKLTFKKKDIDNNGNILNQSKTDCEILNVDKGKDFLKAIGYKKLMNIKENDVVYSNNGFKIAIKDVKNGEKLIEVETIDEDKEFCTIEGIKKKIEELQLPVNTNDYFVKKAEIELKKLL